MMLGCRHWLGGGRPWLGAAPSRFGWWLVAARVATAHQRLQQVVVATPVRRATWVAAALELERRLWPALPRLLEQLAQPAQPARTWVRRVHPSRASFCRYRASCAA